MNSKIALFVSSLNAFNLISYLINKNVLSCVVIANKNSADTHNLAQTLTQYKVAYFLYNQNDTNNLTLLKKADTNLALSFGFSFKIPQEIIDYFKDNIFNIHASDLPKYRGKNPLFWQLRNGEEKSALSLHKVTQNFDEGEIILKEEFEINYQDTFGILNGIVSQLVIKLVENFLELLNTNSLTTLPQITDISFAKEVSQKDIIIDWESMSSLDIYNLTRACNPIFGGAKTIWKDTMLSIFESTIIDMDNLNLEAGTIIHIGSPEGLIITTIDGAIRIDNISILDGIFSGLRFAKRFNMDIGEKLSTIKV